jgi:hypothetical protein
MFAGMARTPPHNEAPERFFTEVPGLLAKLRLGLKGLTGTKVLAVYKHL